MFYVFSYFQALDTLGSTKWRVNKRVLAIIDRIWASGGRIADLVDREDVGSPAENYKICLLLLPHLFFSFPFLTF